MNRLIAIMLLTLVSLLIGACSAQNAPSHAEQANNESSSAAVNTINQAENTSIPAITPEKSDNDAAIEENNDRKPREGMLDLDNIEVAGVEDELVETIISLFKTVEANDYEAHFAFMYDPSTVDLLLIGPYILAVTKLEADQSRLSAVIDEYSLSEISTDVEIVKITMLTSSTDGESSSSFDFVFIKTKGQWKLYKIQ